MHENSAGGGAAADRAGGPLLAAPELLARLGDPRLRVIDARFELSDPAAGRAMYAAGHVPGAIYLDLDRDLADPPGERGRHPLPDPEALAERLGELGVGSEHEVVVYDQDGGMYAARAWWLLRYLGMDGVRFLDGGYRAYLAAGGTVSVETPAHPPATFTVRRRDDMVAEAEEVLARLRDPGLVLLDARAPERYRGETEPLDAVAGHVPGAVNRPYTRSLGAEGLLGTAELAAVHRVAELPAGADVVAYCGSGVSAAHLVLALEVAGRPGVRLYPGSWSEWSRRGLPVATGDEEAEA